MNKKILPIDLSNTSPEVAITLLKSNPKFPVFIHTKSHGVVLTAFASSCKLYSTEIYISNYRENPEDFDPNTDGLSAEQLIDIMNQLIGDPTAIILSIYFKSKDGYKLILSNEIKSIDIDLELEAIYLVM